MTHTLHRALKYYKSNINKILRQSRLSKTPGPKNGPFKPLGLRNQVAVCHATCEYVHIILTLYTYTYVRNKHMVYGRFVFDIRSFFLPRIFVFR